MKYAAVPACRVLVFVLALVIAPHVASVALATTWYVATDGSDSNAGNSPTAPFATPGVALSRAVDNDTIEIQSGTYMLTRQLSVTQTGLTLKGVGGQRAVLVASTKLSGPETVVRVYRSSVTIENLEIQGAAYYGIKLDDADGVQANQTIRNCYIHHTGRDGIKAQRADNVLIEGNEIAFTGVRDASNAEGIDLIGSLGATIRGNYIHDIPTNGLYVKGGTVGAVVEQNLVERTGYAGILLGSETDLSSMRDGAAFEAKDSVARNNIVVDPAMAGLGTVAGWNVHFYNNTVVGAARDAHAAFRAVPNQRGVSPTDIVVKNNIFALASSSTRPLAYLLNAGTLVSDYNVWFSPGGTYMFSRESSGVAESYPSLSDWQREMGVDGNSVAADPTLDADHRPLAGSPALNAGTPLSDLPNTLFEFSNDYTGVERVDGAWDIGAYEGASDGTPPDQLVAPGDLKVAAASTTVVELQWTDRGGSEDGFIIERKSSRQKTFAEIGRAGPGAQTFSDSTVEKGTTYSYRVAAYKAIDTSAYSNEAQVTTPRR